MSNHVCVADRTMAERLSDHVIDPRGDLGVECWRLGRRDTGVAAIYLANFASRLTIAGDVMLGRFGLGLISPPGYSVGWFGGDLSPKFLADVFRVPVEDELAVLVAIHERFRIAWGVERGRLAAVKAAEDLAEQKALAADGC